MHVYLYKIYEEYVLETLMILHDLMNVFFYPIPRNKSNFKRYVRHIKIFYYININCDGVESSYKEVYKLS